MAERVLMTLHMQVVSAATYTENNIVADTWIEESKYLRRVKRVCLYGFDANFDLTYRIQYGNRVVAELASSGAAAPAAGAAEQMITISSKEVCLPSEEFSCYVNGTGTAAGEFIVEFEEIAPPRRRRGRFGRRRFGRRRRFYRRRRY